MEGFPLNTLGFYAAFTLAAFYVQLWGRDYQGKSPVLHVLVTVSALASMIVGLIFLVYLGWQLVWWYPLIFFFAAILISPLAFMVKPLSRSVGVQAFCFFAWPVIAFMMFRSV